MIHNGVHFAALGGVRAAETLASGFDPWAEGTPTIMEIRAALRSRARRTRKRKIEPVNAREASAST